MQEITVYFGKTGLHISPLLALLTFEGKFCGFVHARDSAWRERDARDLTYREPMALLTILWSKCRKILHVKVEIPRRFYHPICLISFVRVLTVWNQA